MTRMCMGNVFDSALYFNSANFTLLVWHIPCAIRFEIRNRQQNTNP